MHTRLKVTAGIAATALLLLGWLLFRSSTDTFQVEDSRIGTAKIFDVPMVYINNCSQCSLSPKAQEIGVFLVPQTFLYNTTGFLDKDSVARQVASNEKFSVQEVFTNYPHGIEAAFRSKATYLIVKDSIGFVSVLSEDVDETIQHEKDYGYSKEELENMQMLKDVSSLDTFWIVVELNTRMFGDFSQTTLPDVASERRAKVTAIQSEFLNKFPREQFLQYKLDQDFPNIYAQMNKTDGILYIQAEKIGLNINSISLYAGKGDPIISR